MDAFGLDPIKIVIYLILITIVYFVLDKFILSKLTKSLDERRNQIDKNTKLAEELQIKMANLEKDVKAKFEEVAKERDGILEKTRKEGMVEREKILEKASLEAKSIVDAGAKRLEQEKADLLSQMNSQVESSVKKAVLSLWEERMEKVDSKLIDSAIKKIQ